MNPRKGIHRRRQSSCDRSSKMKRKRWQLLPCQKSKSSFPTLPDEVIFRHILVRLPPKVLLTFLTVSKTWLSTIAHPTFTSMHADHIRTSSTHHKSHILFTPIFTQYESEVQENPRLGTCTLFRADTSQELELELPKPVASKDRHELVGSANGLVCFTITDGFYLWNPFIRTGQTISQSPHEKYIECCLYCVGFGFDPKTNDYKIIGIPRSFPASLLPSLHPSLHKPRGTYIHIYSLNADSWKQVKTSMEFLEDFVHEERDEGITLGGSLYWLASTFAINPTKKIVSFNLEREFLRNIMLPNYKAEVPDDVFDITTAFSIQVIKDSLHLSISPRGFLHCHVWKLTDYLDTSWVKQYKVVFPGSWLVPENHYFKSAGLMLNGWICMCTLEESSCICLKEIHRYLLYDPKNKSFIDSKRSRCLHCFTCLTESIVGLGHRKMQSCSEL